LAHPQEDLKKKEAETDGVGKQTEVRLQTVVPVVFVVVVVFILGVLFVLALFSFTIIIAAGSRL
jgi:hypothetical protein